jgi:hypothetical protein
LTPHVNVNSVIIPMIKDKMCLFIYN